MTGTEPAAFGSLYYTDCLPGQGLAGGAGFQFQACSPGVDHEVQRTVQRTALYEVPTRWMRERRAVEDYPLSLAHVADDGFVTAAGRYLGKEANGYRDGNQFTHAIVARDRSSFGLVRPAQLWAASWWSSGPAATTTCHAVPAPPEPGEGDTEEVRDRVAADPVGRERLTALVSALGALREPDRRRVLLVTEDGADAARWIAAATLLLDRARALDVTFKIFVTDPDRSPHDVLAVHPDFAAAHMRAAGYLVFDLRHDQVPDVPPSAEATFWVGRFLDGDALDVVDAVELAGQLAGEGPPGAVERTAAVLVVGLEGEVVDPGALRRVAHWLEGADSGAVETVGAALVRSLAERAGDPATVAALDATANRRLGRPGADDLGWASSALEVRRRLFLLETERARDGEVTPGRLPELAGAVDGRTAAHALDTVARDLPPVALALADRHGLAPSDAVIQWFATWWARRPDEEIDVLTWTFLQSVVDALCVELDTRLADPTTRDRTVADIRRRWWRRPGELWRRIPVLGTTGPHDGLRPLDLEIARASYREGGEPRRLALRALAGVLVDRGGDPWVGTWDFVLGQQPVPPADVRRLLEVVPPAERSRPVADVAYRSLLAAPGFDDDAQAALAILEGAGWTPTEMQVAYPPDDPAVAEVVDRLRTGVRADETQELGSRLAKAKRSTKADRERLTAALTEARAFVAGRVLAHVGPHGLRDDAVLPALREVVATGPDGRAAAHALAVLFVCATKSFRSHPRSAERQHDEVRRLVRTLGEADLEATFADLRKDPERMPDDIGVLRKWAELMREEKRPVPPLPEQPATPAHRSPPKQGSRPAPERAGSWWRRGGKKD